jgi:hypothetical protein
LNQKLREESITYMFTRSVGTILVRWITEIERKWLHEKISIRFCPEPHRSTINVSYTSIIQLTIGWMVQGLKPGSGCDFLHLSRPALGPIQTPVKWVPGLLLGGKKAGVWHWPPTPI